MAFDIEMIKGVYKTIGERINKATGVNGKTINPCGENFIFSPLRWNA